ncbi:MAG: tetratricopeptide repeat protein [Cyanophyceae cyanobacterium]
MLKSSQKLLGTLLEEAGLVTAQQLQIALDEQSQEQRRLGEILVLHGWIQPKTAEFFAQKWGEILHSGQKKPLEKYLKEAALLNDVQILAIIKEQRRTGRKFGEVAVLRGWLNPKTIDFFTRHLSSKPKPKKTIESIIKNWSTGNFSADIQAIRTSLLSNTQCNPFWLLKLYQQILQQGAVTADDTPEQTELRQLGLVVNDQGRLKVASPYYQKVFNQSWVEEELAQLRPYRKIRLPLQLEEKASSPERVLQEVLARTKGEPFLSQQLCQLICHHPSFIRQGEESDQVEQLVQTYLIQDWQQGVAAEHLHRIGDHLLQKDRQTGQLLRLYQQILQGGAIADGSLPQSELLQTGLVVQQYDRLQVANPIYQAVFNERWVVSQLAQLSSPRQPHRISSPSPSATATLPRLVLEKKAESPYIVLQTILTWTERQPFLTQKLYQLVYESDAYIIAGQEATVVERLVRAKLIDNWQEGVAAAHFQALHDRLLAKDGGTGRLLRLYQDLLQNQPVRSSSQQQDLLEIGLVKVNRGLCTVHNPIYQEIFSLAWVEQALALLATGEADTNAKPLYLSSSDPKPRFKLAPKVMLLLGTGLIAGLLLVAKIFSRHTQIDSLFTAGNRHISAGNYEAALASYQELLKIDANYYQAWTNRGYALAGLQQYRQMLNSCKTATLIEPEATYAWNCQGEAHHNLAQYQEAVTAFDRATALDVTDPIFLLNKGEALLALGQLTPALDATEQAITLYQQQPNHDGREVAVALSLQGRIHREQQQYEAALADYERALSYAPTYFPAQRDRALTLRDLGRYAEAQTELTTILNSPRLTEEQRAETWFYQGLTLCDLLQPQAGKAAFEQALLLKPDYEAAAAARRSCG